MDGLPCYQPSSVREEIAQREDAEVRRANGPPDRLAFVVDDIPEGARLAFVTSASLSQRGLMLLSGIVWDPVATLIDPDKAPVSCFFVASRRPEEDRSFRHRQSFLRRRYETAPEAAGFQATLSSSTWNREIVLL